MATTRRSSTLYDYDADVLITRPFLPRDMFKLIVKLESRKTLEPITNPESLEQQFCVPSGYAADTFSYDTSGTPQDDPKVATNNNTKDQSKDSRNSFWFPMSLHGGVHSDIPGPGAYNVGDHTTINQALHPDANFASGTKRDLYQFDKACGHFTGRGVTTAPPKNASSPPGSGQHRPRSRRKPFITGAERGLLTPLSPAAARPHSNPTTTTTTMMMMTESTVQRRRGLRLNRSSSMGQLDTINHNHTRSSTPKHPTFDRALRSASNSFLSLGEASRHDHLGPGTYPIKLPQTPCAATFGKSKMNRQVLWGPVWAPLANSLPQDWNTSDEYLLQRKKLLRAIRKQGKKRNRAKAKAKAKAAAAATAAKSATNDHRLSIQHQQQQQQLLLQPDQDQQQQQEQMEEKEENAFDPFQWVRKQHRGQSRANYLAGKYGLTQFVKELTLEELEAERQVAPMYMTSLTSGSISNSNSNSNNNTARADSSRQEPSQEAVPDQLDVVNNNNNNNNNNSNGNVLELATAVDGVDGANRKPTDLDAGFVLNCRFPGGMMCSIPTRRFRKVLWVKNCLKRRFTSLKHKRFDLFWQGQKLADEASIGDCGVHDQTRFKSNNVVQVVLCT